MVSPAGVKLNKGWFRDIGRDGDRTVEQQMQGLEQVVAEVAGKTVIDVGCAEGLISLKLIDAGAKQTLGFEVVRGHVALARELAGAKPCKFVVADLNHTDLRGTPKADIVLMLAILHKLKDPSAVCAAFADLTLDLAVIRLPPSGAVIVDARSMSLPHDIGAVMASRGFHLESVVDGPFNEWTGYFRRGAARAEAVTGETPADAAETKDAFGGTKDAAGATDDPKSATEPSESGTEALESGTPAQASETAVEDATATAAVAPPPPGQASDELKVEAPNAEVQTGRRLFPSGRREARVKADKADGSK